MWDIDGAAHARTYERNHWKSVEGVYEHIYEYARTLKCAK